MEPQIFKESLEYLREAIAEHPAVAGKITVAVAHVHVNGEPGEWVGFVIGFPPEFCGHGPDRQLLMDTLAQRARDYEEAPKCAPKMNVQPIEPSGFIASYFKYVYRQS